MKDFFISKETYTHTFCIKYKNIESLSYLVPLFIILVSERFLHKTYLSEYSQNKPISYELRDEKAFIKEVFGSNNHIINLLKFIFIVNKYNYINNRGVIINAVFYNKRERKALGL